MFFPAIFAAKNQSLEYMSNIDQEHRITYKAGITRTPSDFLCQDGELAECINLTTDNEELKPIVMPAEFISAAYNGETAIDMPKILYIHKYNDRDRYIVSMKKTISSSDVNVLAWGIKDSTNFRLQGEIKVGTKNIIVDDTTNITSVGKTLIVADNRGPIRYYLWKSDGSTLYKELGELPTPKMKFWHYGGGHYQNTGLYTGILDLNQAIDYKKIKDQEKYNDLLVGLYEKCKKTVAQKKCFCNPFFVRCALELYDGTYTKITNPVLMYPAVTSNSHVTAVELNSEENLQVAIWGFELFCNQSVDYTDLSDIVKDVVIFISAPIDLYDLTVDQHIHPLDNGDVIRDCIFGNPSEYHRYTNTGLQNGFDALVKKDDREMLNALQGTSIFYKLCGVGIKSTGDISTASKFETHKLENITTAPRLEYDDYYSQCPMHSELLFAYNSRLNIANVARGFFEGFDFFMPLDNATENTYYFYVNIETDDGDKWIKHVATTKQKQGIYFYYPDPRAKHVTIYENEETQQEVYNFRCILDADLTEHPGLNGAYYMDGMPRWNTDAGELQIGIPTFSGSDITLIYKKIEDPDGVTVGPDGWDTDEQHAETDQCDNDDSERLPNYIITSEVNNPFTFTKEGYNKVGTGKILAISTTTMALSQDMFGKNPLVVFSESGVWGMSVDRTGLFDGINPFTRDVAINPKNIIQTDGAIFFVSNRGLMMVTTNETNDRGVRCVSELMNGKPFNATTLSGLTPQEIQGESNPAHPWYQVLIQTIDSSSFLTYLCSEYCKISYDYIESRLFMINPQKRYNFMLNLKDGTISKSIFPFVLTNVVNNYPDYLLQSNEERTDGKSGKVYSFYEKPREEAVTSRNLYSFLLTRPMKLAGPVSKASLRQLKNVGFWDEGTPQTPLSLVKTVIYLSDDLKTWYLDSSRFGTAAKYYRLALFINMLPSERLSGTIITSQERRTNNFR